ncbi:MAG: hypothetical protein ACLRR6_12035 [Oscillospiraceae bacterium]
MTDTDGILPYMYGVWEDIAVYQTVKTVEGAPEFEEWIMQQPEGTTSYQYGLQYYKYRVYSKNLKTGEEKNDRRRVGKFRMDGGSTHELGTVRRVSD